MMTTLLATFINQTQTHPENTAIISGDLTLSYRELDERRLSLVHLLKCQQLSKGDRVALLLDNSPNYIAAYYAVWSLGCVVVPLNTELKEADVANLIQHSDSRLVLTESKHIGKCPADGYPNPETINVETINVETRNLNTIPQHWDNPNAPEFDDHASIIYTSGTTGNPKGVLLSHRNLATNAQAIVRCFELDQRDRAICTMPFFYSYGNSIMHSHLATGGSLVLENSFMYPQTIVERMKQHHVTGFYGVPSTYVLLLDKTNIQTEKLPALRFLAQAGGAMPIADVKWLREALPKVQLFLMYGQTEASARLSCLPANQVDAKPGSVGLPIAGVEIEVRDNLGHKCAPNITGEICARGDNVMQGYWKDTAATETCVQNGWLYTGDLGYQDQDGYLYIVSRRKDIIKSGAHRISPREIEEKVLELPFILEAAVVGVPDRVMGQTIKAFVVPKQNLLNTFKTLDILRHCRLNLPAYKIPKTIEIVETLPKTASGKVKKFALM